MSDAETPIFPDAVEVRGIIYPPGSTLGPRTQINLTTRHHVAWAGDGYCPGWYLHPFHQEYFEFTNFTPTQPKLAVTADTKLAQN